MVEMGQQLQLMELQLQEQVEAVVEANNLEQVVEIQDLVAEVQAERPHILQQVQDKQEQSTLAVVAVDLWIMVQGQVLVVQV
jgi:hypothetical protein